MRPQVRVFGMGIFFTTYYEIMLVTPPVAGAILEATGNLQGPIWLAILLFAAVVPLVAAFQKFKDMPHVGLDRKL
jgi:4-hydroxybenzoate polyprenyltransferase